MDRAGRSRWPEADKIRQAHREPRGGWAHPPREDVGREMAWPRASFGLPIQFQFQGKTRQGGYYAQPEPRGNQARGNHLLLWSSGGKRHERLPSPLIVKPMQLLDGRVVPIAVWFHRELPGDARVGLAYGAGLQQGTEAQFDRLRGEGDTDYLTPLIDRDTTRDAFIAWLNTEFHLPVVTL